MTADNKVVLVALYALRYEKHPSNSIPMLVDYSPSILSVLMAIPGIKQISESFVRHTFFAQVSFLYPDPGFSFELFPIPPLSL